MSSSSSHSLNELAPSGVSAWSGPTVNIINSSHGDTLVVKANIPLCSIGLAPSGSLPGVGGSFSCMQFSANQGYGAGTAIKGMSSVALGPQLLLGVESAHPAALDVFWTYACFPDCALINLIAAAFGKYRMRSDVTLHYLPQTTTIDPSNFCLCFTDDPMHPVQGFGSYTDPTTTGATAPNYNTTKNSMNSVVFASWATWSKRMPTDKSAVYYTTSSLVSSLFVAEPFNEFSPFFNAEPRFSHFGCLTGFANSKSTSTTFDPKGELYMEVEYEFFDFVPVTAVSSVPYSLLLSGTLSGQILLPRLRVKTGEGESKLSSLDDDFETPDNSFAVSKLRIGPRDPPSVHRFSTVKSFRLAPKVTVSQLPRSRAIVKLKGPTGHKPSLSTGTRLQHVISHLHNNLHRLPKTHHALVTTAHKAVVSKSGGWKKAAVSAVKTLAKEIPIVGPILSELTGTFGESVIDWISKLF